MISWNSTLGKTSEQGVPDRGMHLPGIDFEIITISCSKNADCEQSGNHHDDGICQCFPNGLAPVEKKREPCRQDGKDNREPAYHVHESQKDAYGNEKLSVGL